jgi:hypothetical protein
VAHEDLAIKFEVLHEKLEVLQNEVKELREWANWLYRLYGFLHKIFHNAPVWKHRETGVWVEPPV